MKEIIILVLSISLVSALAGVANAMRSSLNPPTSNAQSITERVTLDNQSLPSPIVYDQPPEDEEHWPGSRK